MKGNQGFHRGMAIVVPRHSVYPVPWIHSFIYIGAVWVCGGGSWSWLPSPGFQEHYQADICWWPDSHFDWIVWGRGLEWVFLCSWILCMKADSGFERLCLISTYHTQFRNKFAGVRLSPLCAQASTSFVFGSPSGFWIFVELQHCLYPWRTRIFWTGTGCWAISRWPAFRPYLVGKLTWRSHSQSTQMVSYPSLGL